MLQTAFEVLQGKVEQRSTHNFKSHHYTYGPKFEKKQEIDVVAYRRSCLVSRKSGRKVTDCFVFVNIERKLTPKVKVHTFRKFLSIAFYHERI